MVSGYTSTDIVMLFTSYFCVLWYTRCIRSDAVPFPQMLSERKATMRHKKDRQILDEYHDAFPIVHKKNSQEPELLHLCNGTLPKNSNFKAQNRFIVFIPGFMFGVCELDSISEIKNELLKKGDFNVLLVDGKDEYGMDFVYAKENSKRAANIIIKVLQNIQDETGFENKDLYLIGHSLGAHTAGMVGQGFKVNRITGLDPGGVVFSKNTPDDMILDRNDAELVDVIHTNGGKGLPHLGISFPMGDADFYVNGGTIQPSCSYRAWNSIKSLNFCTYLGWPQYHQYVHTRNVSNITN
ncbi:pancreatic lipase-related protein 2 [Caerostris extrusa]|uniref:Pancreatic lipase-related protein 2 n=1 Tax=Caerostris extrusa TaxID=172846 RepID=A0AAV4WIG4_CAEEX|nr:pancreatic lipase-related protein 2 [Caerostris extrusa]